MKKLATDILVVSIAYTIAYWFQHFVLMPFNNHDRASVFFVPAAVRLMSAMVYGYRAGAGIMLGALLFYHLFNDTGLDNEIEYILVAGFSGLACSIALLIWALTSDKVVGIRHPKVVIRNINAFDVLQFAIIQALVDTVLSHALFYFVPGIMPEESLHWVLVTFVGNFTGAFLVFIMLNLVYTLTKWVLFMIHDHRSKF